MKSLIPSLISIVAGLLMAWPWLDERAFAAAWVGMALVVGISYRQQPHVAFRRSLLAGLTGLATAFHWLPTVASDNLHVSLLSGLMTAALAITWDAFRFGVFGYLTTLLRQRGVETGFVWPIVWVALEWGWPHIFPWRLGHSQLGWLPACQVAEFTGVYGVSFLMVWVAAVVAPLSGNRCSVRCDSDPIAAQSTGSRFRRTALTCAAAVFAIIVWGYWRIGDLEAQAAERPTLRVALIQPGAGTDFLQRLRDTSLSLSETVDLVVWPESCVDDFSLTLTSFRSADEVRQNTRYDDDSRPCHGLGTPLLCGGGSFPEGAADEGPFFNTAFLIDADENIAGRYHKRFLMPWGEYVVGQQWIPGLQSLLGSSNNRPGDSAAPLRLPDGPKLGVLICYEDLLAEPVRQTTAEGAEVLLNLNNLSIFGETAALFQHQQIARFRAIENRRSLLRCGMVGSTAVVTATGRIEQQAIPHRHQSVIVESPLFKTKTFYTRHGDVFAYGCILSSILMCVRRRP